MRERYGARNPRSQQLRMIAGGGSKIKDPTVSIQGSTVAFESWIYEINIWQHSLTGEGDAAPYLLGA